MIYLGIVEDESLMLQSIKETFTEMPNVTVTLAARSMEECLERLTPEVELNMLLLDINLPKMSGVAGIPHLKALRPDIDIIMLTNKDSADDIFDALCAGAVSYISKMKASPPILREAVTTVSRGGSYMSPSIARKVVAHFTPPDKSTPNPILTTRQHEIVTLLTDGLSYKMIAGRLGISVETVRDHIKKIYRILEVNSKAQVIRKKLDGDI